VRPDGRSSADAAVPGGANGPSARLPRAFRLLLAAAVGLFTVAAGYTSVLIGERQDTLGRVSRYNVAWLASQATAEHFRLQRQVAAYLVPGTEVDKDEVQLRLDILANRAAVMQGADFVEVAHREPELRDIVARLARVLDQAQPMLDALDDPGVGARLLALLATLDGPLSRLGATANAYVGDRVSEDQRELTRLHWLFTGVVAGLILCGLGLIGMIVWNNRLLQQAHRGLSALAATLRRASTELEAANLTVRRANAGLHTQNERFDAALNNMSQALCMVDGRGRLIVCNSRYLEMFGLGEVDARPGAALDIVRRGALAAGRYPAEVLEAVAAEQDRLAGDAHPGTFVRDQPDGPALAVAHRPMANGGWVATYEDITERRRVEARVAHMAHHDSLTDLPNRVLLHDRIEEALARVRRYGGGFALLYLDLDHFKEVNDTLGHPAGDALLSAVSRRLRGCIRESDFVARLGGDEFALLQHSAEQPVDAAALAERVVAALEVPFDLDGNRVAVGASVGIAVAPQDGDDADRLLRCADMALYHAKGDGRGGHRFFESFMDAQIHARRAIQADLRDALPRSEFEMFYQPIFDIALNQICGYEALIRWRHPTRGMVSPAEFIPIAEETGMIIPIGEWVMRTACAEAARWPISAKVAVNLSPVQFRSPALAQMVSAALEESGLAPGRLELEITETALLRDNEAVLAALHRLRGLGVRIALDDFGTGYSSLGYLRSFPFDKIKVDQSFVRDMEIRPDCAAIVESVAHLATSLGMGATAEGVETEAQLRRVEEAGCTEAQGYYFDEPKPAAELFRLPLGRKRTPRFAA